MAGSPQRSPDGGRESELQTRRSRQKSDRRSQLLAAAADRLRRVARTAVADVVAGTHSNEIVAETAEELIVEVRSEERR